MIPGCIVKEQLGTEYNQAHLGLVKWSLLYNDTDEFEQYWELNFKAGYLVGLEDLEGIQEIR
jgi:hypothetical protein